MSEQPGRLCAEAPVALFRASPGGDIVDVNDALVALMGYPDRETLLATPARHLFDESLIVAGTQAGLTADPVCIQTVETEAVHYGGRRMRLQVRAQPAIDDTGEVTHYEGVLIDVTAQAMARDSLLRSEARYKHLFTSSQVAMFEEDYSGLVAWLDLLRADGVTDLASYVAEHPEEVDRAGRLVRVTNANPAAFDLVGVRDSEDLARGFAEHLTIGPGRDAFLAQLVSLWNGEETFSAEVSARRPNGEPLDVLVSWVMDRDAGPAQLARVVVSVSDITEQKNRERELSTLEKRFRGVIEAAPIGMAVLSPTGSFRLANLALESMLGYSRRELETMSWTLLLGRDSADGVEIMRGLRNGRIEQTEFEAEIRRADGNISAIRVHMAVLPSEPDDVRTPIVQVVDLTKRKAMERELESLLARREELIASVSHAVRTPLTAVVGFAQHLRDNSDGLDEFEKAEAVREICNESLTMSHLIHDLLVVGRSQSDALTAVPARVDVGETAAAALAGIIGWETVEWKLDGSATAWVDRGHLSHMLRNLLTSAGERCSGAVSLEVSQGNGNILVSVTHDGPAVPVEFRSMQFEPFSHPGDATSPSPLGLGLNVARRLAELNGGELSYHEDGPGPRFDLALPRPDPVF